MSYTREEWGYLLKLPKPALSTHVQNAIIANRKVIEAWVNGEPVEIQDDGEWVPFETPKPLFNTAFLYRVAPKIEVSFHLTKNQAASLAQILQEAKCCATNTKLARDIFLKAVHDGIMKVGYAPLS